MGTQVHYAQTVRYQASPVGGAHLAVLSHKLERGDEAQGLVHRPADRQVVHGDLLQHAL